MPSFLEKRLGSSPKKTLIPSWRSALSISQLLQGCQRSYAVGGLGHLRLPQHHVPQQYTLGNWEGVCFLLQIHLPIISTLLWALDWWGLHPQDPLPSGSWQCLVNGQGDQLFESRPETWPYKTKKQQPIPIVI